MEYHLFIVLIVLGFGVFYLSTRPHQTDISNTYQLELAFLGFIIWVATAFSSFNIEYILYDGTGISVTSRVDYAYIGLSIAMLLVSLINLIIIFTYGSFNRYFNLK